jgi:hypothetical protein
MKHAIRPPHVCFPTLCRFYRNLKGIWDFYFFVQTVPLEYFPKNSYPSIFLCCSFVPNGALDNKREPCILLGLKNACRLRQRTESTSFHKANHRNQGRCCTLTWSAWTRCRTPLRQVIGGPTFPLFLSLFYFSVLFFFLRFSSWFFLDAVFKIILFFEI